MTLDLDRLTEAELLDLNRRVVERLRFLHQMRAHSAMLKFSIGDRVCFETDDLRTVAGTLQQKERHGGRGQRPPLERRARLPAPRRAEGHHPGRRSAIRRHPRQKISAMDPSTQPVKPAA